MYKTKSGREITFVGQGNTDIKVTGIQYEGIKNLDDLFATLLESGWGTDTISKSNKNYDQANNPTQGQCSITAALVQTIFGGQLAQVSFANGGKHSINFINDRYIDLTSDQFSIKNEDSLGGDIEIVEIGKVIRDMNLLMRHNLLGLKLARATATKLQQQNPDKLKRDGLPRYTEGVDANSFLSNFEAALNSKPAHTNNRLFHLVGERLKIAEAVKSADSKEAALTELAKAFSPDFHMTSASLASQDNPRQIAIDDSTYKHSNLICEAEQKLLLKLVENIKQK